MNKKLADWIKSEEAQGFSEKQLRKQLIKQGCPAKELEDAIKSIRKNEASSKFSVKEVFKPTVLKLFFPILVLVLIIISFSINSKFIPPLGEQICNQVTFSRGLANFNNNISEKEVENNANPLEIIGAYEQKENFIEEYSMQVSTYDNTIPPVYGNAYWMFSEISRLDPFFPIPCESGLVRNSFDNKFCRYYISQESYNCINYNSNLPPYNKISSADLIFPSLILIALIYVIVCLFAYCNRKLSEKENKYKFIVAMIACILFLILNSLYDIFYTYYYHKYINLVDLIFPSIALIVLIYFSYLAVQDNKKLSEKENKVVYIVNSILLILFVLYIFYRKNDILDLLSHNRYGYLSDLVFPCIELIELIYLSYLTAQDNKKLFENENKAVLIVNSILFILLVLYFFYGNNDIPRLLMYPFMFVIVFVAFSFIRNNNTGRAASYISILLFFLLLIGGIFLLNHLAERNRVHTEIFKENVAYKFYKCNATRILSLEEKQKLLRSTHLNDSVESKYLDEEWKVCDTPSCLDMCKNYCDKQQYDCGEHAMMDSISLRGDNPSCICGWRIN